MTVEEMKTLLDTVTYTKNNTTYHVPVAYRFFRAPQDPPFICFYVDGTDNEFADNSVHKTINQWTVELYTENKNPILEKNLEAVLPVWNKTESYIDTENMILNAYTFEDVE